MIFAIFFSDKVLVLLLMLFLILTLVFWSKISLKIYAKANKLIIFTSAFVAISLFCITYYNNPTKSVSESFWENFNTAFAVFLRLILLALSNSVFLFTTSTGEISKSIEYLLYPLNFLGLNTRKFSFAISMSIKFVPIISQEIGKIIISQKSRGVNFKEKNVLKRIRNYSKIAAPLMRNILKKSDALACSMISRGYSLEKPRTQFKKITIKKCDIIYLFLFPIIIFGVMVCENMITKNLNSIHEILH